MSKSVEERVVGMRFDNQQFEMGVQTSMGTLEKLKQALKLDGATKGLEEIDGATKKVDMSGLSSAVETVKSRFSALEVVAITALANLTNSVVNAGKQLISSFTIEPIKQGFEEYELKMGAVQTIMASTGADIKTVNGYLDELNTYADKTIYSFSDMTQNIGKFTNAGVSLDAAVKAIQGISNEAAVSGANANEASRAMYNFAQALSSGAVKLIDWKSIENANMATVEFKQSLLDTAVALGTVEKVGDEYQSLTTDMQGSNSGLFTATSMFNDSLSAQWMTTEVLVQTLGNYATDVREMTAEEKKAYEEKLRGIGYTEEQIVAIEKLGQKAFDSAQDVKTFSQLMDTLKEATGSGWTQTFEILFGDLEEAKVLWTSIYKVVGGFIDRTSQARNEMLQGWRDLGGQKDLVDSVKNAFAALGSVVKPVSEAFREIFPPVTAERLASMTRGLKEFTSHLKLSDKDAQNLKSTFKGVFAILDILKQAFTSLMAAIFPMTSELGGLGSGILSVTGAMGEWFVSLDQAIKENNVFGEVIAKVHNFIAPIFQSSKGFILGAVDAIKEFAKTHFVAPDLSGLEAFSDKLKERFGSFQNIGELAQAALGKLVEVLSSTGSILEKLGGIVVDTFEKVFDGISNAFQGKGFDNAIDLLNGGILVGIGAGVMKFVNNITDMEDMVGDVVEGAQGLMEGVQDVLDGAKGALTTFQQNMKFSSLVKIASAIAILAGSLFVLSMIDSDKLGGALASITILFGELAGTMVLFDKVLSGETNFKKVASTMMGISVAVLILASALKKISEIDQDKLAGALLSITVLMGGMAAVAIALSKWGGKIKTGALSMIAFAGAINILAEAVRKLGEMEPEKLKNGLIGVGVVMGELAAFMIASKFGGFNVSQGLAIIELSAALLILEKAVSGFGEMDVEVLRQGLAGVGTILAEVALFSVIAGNAKHIFSTATALTVIGAAMLIFGKAIKDIGSLDAEVIGKGLLGIGGALAAVAIAVNFMPKNMIFIGLGLIEVAAALKIIGGVFKDTGEMKWEEIGKGMTVLAGSMLILGVALNAMKGTMGAATSLLIVSAALAILTPVLKGLGSMSLPEIGKALLILAGAFTVIGVAGVLLGPVVPAILALSAAVALLGVAVAACGVGLLAFSAGLASLAVSGVAGAAALVTVLELLIVGILGVIARSAEAIANAVKAVVLAVVGVIVECGPAIAEGALKLVEEVLKSVVEHTPTIVNYLIDFLLGVVTAITARLPELIKAAMDFIGAFFQGVVDALKGVDTTALLNGIVGIGLLSAMMYALASVAWLVPEAMIGVIGMGAIIAEMAVVLAAVGIFAQLPGLKWLINEGGELLQGVGTAIGKFAGGIIGGFLGGISAQFPQIGLDLSGFMTNAKEFIEGAKRIDPAMMDGVNSLAQTILLLTAANILDGLTKWFTGGSSLAKFGEELASFGPYFKQYTNDIAGIDPAVVTASANAALALAEMASKLPNSGGLAGKIFGENNISAFGAELEQFGPHIKKYGDDVAGLNAEAVTASANAAQVLSDMASKLPNSGGLSALIFGDNTLSAFGAELEKFGPHIAKYAQDVAGIQPEVVTASANAARALSELADNLPNTGGLVSLFTGDNDIGAFGQSLEAFGQSFSGYYTSVSGINTSLLGKVVVELGKIVNMAKGISDVDVSGLSGFGMALTTLGNNGLAGFLSAFTDSNDRVYAAVSMMMSYVSSGIAEQQDTCKKTMGNVLSSLSATIKDTYSDFYSCGQTVVTNITSGIRFQSGNATVAISQMVAWCASAINNSYSDFYNAGDNLVVGFSNGISVNTFKAEAAAKAMAAAAAAAARKELDEHSPSKVGYQIGDFFGMPFVQAIENYAGKAYDAGAHVSEMAKKGMVNAISQISDFLDGRLDAEPTIRPVLDLSNVEEKTAKLDALFSRNYASSISIGMNHWRAGEMPEMESVQTGNTVYNLTQINNSPKPLSRLEIYRQTNNLFSRLQEVRG